MREPNAPALALFGRDREMGILKELIDGLGKRGRGMVISGDPGIGKSALLAAAGAAGRERGFHVLACAGVQAEGQLPFAGLHQLLRPIEANITKLPKPQQAAILAAFGMLDTGPPSVFLIALGALNLLADAADDSPVVLIVDDTQWLDRSTVDVLAFIARRLESDPIALLAATRERTSSSLVEAGLPEVRLEGLDEAAANALLSNRHPDLAPMARLRLLAEAAGNPLALLELSAEPELGRPTRTEQLSPPRALTARLERAFYARAAELPEPTRTLLLISAVDEGGNLVDVLNAGATLLDPGVTARTIEPAVAAGLIELDRDGLRFRHPLVRSAIIQAASITEQHSAHAALASVLRTQPDRRAWHLAASTLGPDEAIASELEVAGKRAQRRGAVLIAIDAYKRAAELATELPRRNERLLRAAELAFDFGQREAVAHLLGEIDPSALEARNRGRVSWLEETAGSHIPSDARVMSLVEAADSARAVGDSDTALDLLWTVAARCWWANAGYDVRGSIVAAADRIGRLGADPRIVANQAAAAPVERGKAVIEHLKRPPSETRGDADAARVLGTAALVVGAFDLAVDYLAAAERGLREHGQLGYLARVLALQAWAMSYTVGWTTALPVAEEGGRMAQETGEQIWVSVAHVVKAVLAAIHGDARLAESLAAQAERVALPAGATFILTAAQIARGLAALGTADHAEAHDHFRRIFDPVDPAFHSFMRCWAIGDFAEAAVNSGHRDEAQALTDSLAPMAIQSQSPWLQLTLAHARALLADDENAAGLFQAALSADTTRWPLYRARVLLAYGAWLRRQRRAAEARAASHGSRLIRCRRRRQLGGASQAGTASFGRNEPRPHSGSLGAVASGDSNCSDGRRWNVQSRHRPQAVRLAPNRGIASVSNLSEAWGDVAFSASSRADTALSSQLLVQVLLATAGEAMRLRIVCLDPKRNALSETNGTVRRRCRCFPDRWPAL